MYAGRDIRGVYHLSSFCDFRRGRVERRGGDPFLLPVLLLLPLSTQHLLLGGLDLGLAAETGGGSGGFRPGGGQRVETRVFRGAWRRLHRAKRCTLRWQETRGSFGLRRWIFRLGLPCGCLPWSQV